ncbi:MAG: ATP-grasp domain-containing protein [Deltaproteobacteria bacterium]|nr:ATP-grasp domain-containing protein [Deltaproteobacteria bacterium]
MLATVVDTAGLVRLPMLLSIAGCAVTLIASRGLAITRSRFLRQRIVDCQAVAEVVERLRRQIDTEEYAAVIIGDEIVLHELAKCSDQAWARRCLPVKPACLAVILSKHEFTHAARLRGVPTPKEHICADIESAVAAAHTLNFPLVLKQPSGFSGQGVRQVGDETHLRSVWLELGGGPLAIQEFLTGRVGSTEILFQHGRPLAWTCNYMVRAWPTDFTASCIRQWADLPFIEPWLEEIGQLTGFTGFAGIDWIHDPTSGSFHVIEFNPRPTPGLYLGVEVRVDFARAFVGALAGRTTVTRPQRASRPLAVMFPQAVFWGVDHQDFRTILQALQDVPVRDPWLALALLRRILTHYLPPSLRRKH